MNQKIVAYFRFIGIYDLYNDKLNKKYQQLILDLWQIEHNLQHAGINSIYTFICFDSVIFAIDRKNTKVYSAFIDTLEFFLSLCLSHSIFVQGILSVGEFVYDNELGTYYGQSVIDSFNYIDNDYEKREKPKFFLFGLLVEGTAIKALKLKTIVYPTDVTYKYLKFVQKQKLKPTIEQYFQRFESFFDKTNEMKDYVDTSAKYYYKNGLVINTDIDSYKLVKINNIKKESLVIVIEVLGFRKMVENKSVNKNIELLIYYLSLLEGRFQYLITQMNILSNRINGENFEMDYDDYFSTFIYSDSIILVLKKTDEEVSYQTFFYEFFAFFRTLIIEDIPVVCGIAYGELLIKEKLRCYFGLPLFNAFREHKKINFYGISIHESAKSLIDKIGLLKQYQKKFNELYTLNWLLHCENSYKPVYRFAKEYKNHMKRWITKLPSRKTQQFVENTIEYIEQK